VVDGQFVLREAEKGQFVALMREYEAFCGLRVVTYCVMSNHFHLLVEVPTRPEPLPSDEQLLERVERLSGLAGGGTTRQMLERFRRQGQNKAAEELRERFFERMWERVHETAQAAVHAMVQPPAGSKRHAVGRAFQERVGGGSWRSPGRNGGVY
jgi:REP element-mobilizing transposase RayT